MNLKPLAFGDLAGIVACLALALAAHLETLPAWVIAAVAVSATLRLALARRGRPAPPRAVRLLVAALAVALLFVQLHTFNGLSAGTALLALMAGLKLLETDTRRDIYIVTLIIYFVCVSALLESDSFWLLAYLIGVCWLTSATLLRLATSLPAPGWPGSLRYAGKLLGQALPLALAFWLFFPRFAGPLWQLPNGGESAGTGLSDTMSPGDITELAQSDEIAFRVHFAGAVPPPRERYWRGPVMHDFDGHTWKRAYPLSYGAPKLLPQGAAYTYTISLEPHDHRWVFALDWPSQWNLPRGALTSDYTLVQPDPVSRPIDVVVTSHTHVQVAAPLSTTARRRDTRVPSDRNPRTLQLARTLRAANPDDFAYVQAVLSLFAQQPFYYTLTPPKLSDDSVDEFLFDTRRGFCGHYASAFAALMRAAGIPAHVVTGYYGGTFNRFADYWIVRQNEAHAWDEVWLEGHGWMRIDPTSVIAPERVEHTDGDTENATQAAPGRWQPRAQWLTDARLRLDALRQVWRERILLFDQDSQQQLLESLHIPQPDGQKLVLVLTGALILVLGWLTWTVRREIDPTRNDRLSRAYARLCAKLAAAGIARRAPEGAEDYAARVAQARPDLGPRVAALCRQYSDLRYGAGGSPAAVARFSAEVRAFRPPLKPPGSRASSGT